MQNERRPDGTVLKYNLFKCLVNPKSGITFSYSYPVVQRKTSINADADIQWIENANKTEQKKIDQVKMLYNELVEMNKDLLLAAKDEDKGSMRHISKTIVIMEEKIQEVIYPLKDREYVEAAEAKRARLAEQGELKLDATTIAALTGNAPGATADASVAEAKLKLAEERIALLEKDAAKK